jgi:hypothetical protein
MKPLVYIAGPYTRPCPVANTRAAIEVMHRLWKSGVITPICPHLSLLADMVCPMPYTEWLKLDLELLRRCDAVLRMPGDSYGADCEVDDADRCGIKVFEDENALYAWAVKWMEEKGSGR